MQDQFDNEIDEGSDTENAPFVDGVPEISTQLGGTPFNLQVENILSSESAH
jgi:hypothetical protein